MSVPVSELLALASRLHEEEEIAPPAALMSNVAAHYDRRVAKLIFAKERRVIAAVLPLLADTRAVRKLAPPHHAVEGGYGKTFGAITVADKARFVLEKLLGAQLAAEAAAAGPPWYQVKGQALNWDDGLKRFTL